jgi:hypothetical protein
MTDPQVTGRRLIVGGAAIAAFCGHNLGWLRRQRERSKSPPPAWRSATGGCLYAYADELTEWIEMRKPKTRR